MPTILRDRGYRVYFYSYDCSERRHVHVDKENKSVKYWITPVISQAENFRFGRVELREIERMLGEHLEELHSEWDRHCG